MEPLSKKEKVDQIAESFKAKVLAVLDEIKARAYEHIDQNPDAEIDFEKLLQEGIEPLTQSVLEMLFGKEGLRVPIEKEGFRVPVDKEGLSQSKKIEKRALFLGLDRSGKTTALYILRLGEKVTTIPTIGFNVETIERKGVSLVCWDVGGQPKIQDLWRHYFLSTNVVFYFVDGSDNKRIAESAEKFRGLLEDDQLIEALFVIFVTKSDRANFDMEIVKTEFGIATLSRPHRIYGVNVTDTSSFNSTFEETISWLEEQWGIYVHQD